MRDRTARAVATKDVGEEGGAERALESKAWSGRAWLTFGSERATGDGQMWFAEGDFAGNGNSSAGARRAQTVTQGCRIGAA